MDVRYYIDPETELPHIHRHGVAEQEIEEVLQRPMEDRPGPKAHTVMDVPVELVPVVRELIAKRRAG